MSLNRLIFAITISTLTLTVLRETLVLQYSSWSQSDVFYLKLSFFQIATAIMGDAFSRILLSEVPREGAFEQQHRALYVLLMPIISTCSLAAAWGVEQLIYLLSLSAAITSSSFQLISKSKSPKTIALASALPTVASFLYVYIQKDTANLFECFVIANVVAFFICYFKVIADSGKCAFGVEKQAFQSTSIHIIKNVGLSFLNQTTVLIERSVAVMIGDGALTQIYLMRRIAGIPHIVVMPLVNASMISRFSRSRDIYIKYERGCLFIFPIAVVAVVLSPYINFMLVKLDLDKMGFLMEPQWIAVFLLTVFASYLRSTAQIAGPILGVGAGVQFKIGISALVEFIVFTAFGVVLGSVELLAVAIPFYGLSIWFKMRRKYVL